MSELPLWAYAVVLALSLGVSAVLTPLALAAALHHQILDHPGPAKSHGEAVPYLGGAAIAVAFSLAVAAMAVVDHPARGLVTLGTVLGCAVVLALVGLADDVRHVPVWVRLVVEGAAGVVLWRTGIVLHLAHVPTWLDVAGSVLFVVVVTNAVNLLDNMDGLAAGLVGLVALGFFGIAVLNGDFLVAALAVALAGCAGGFLWHNFHPARIFMGDSGSLFLGFLLATLALKLRSNPVERVDVAALLSVLAVPLFDTSLVVVARLGRRVSPMRGGRDHTSHRLRRRGLGVRATVSAIYAVAVLSDGAGIVLDLQPTWRVAGLAVLALLWCVGLGVLLFVDRHATADELWARQEAGASAGTGHGVGPSRPVTTPRPQPVLARWALSTLAKRER